MNKILIIAWREFIEVVRTKAFIISVVFMPVLITGFIFATKWFARIAGEERVGLRRIAVVDRSHKVFDNLRREIDKHNTQNPNRPFEAVPVPPDSADVNELRARVRRAELYAYIIIPPDAVTAEAPCEVGRKDNRIEESRKIRDIVGEAVITVRFNEHQPPLDRDYIQRIQRPVPIETIDVQTAESATGDDMARILTPFAFMFLLFMGVMNISMGLLTSLIEEKSSRIVEVLLSAVSPIQLMAGKILGLTVVGSVLLLVWGALGAYSARAYGMGYLVTPYRLTYAALYFVPSFLMMSAVLAGIGSVCNSLKDAQSMTTPITIVNIVPMVLWLQISQNPTSTFSHVLSFIPPITPYVMILRICADPDTPLWQIVVTLLLLWLSVLFAIWAAAKVFRIGVLMYGKPPTPRELFRWIRQA